MISHQEAQSNSLRQELLELDNISVHALLYKYPVGVSCA